MAELSKQISTQINERIRYGLTERIRIDICCDNKQHIWLCISKNNNIETIIELCNPFIEFITNIKKEFDLNCSLEVVYDDNSIKTILVMNDNNHITVENLLEGYTFIKKIYELQIKYCSETYFYMACNRFVIENIDTEYIDLLDFIPNHQKKKIVNGYITNINNYNSKFMQSKNIHFSPSTIIVKIKNCPNLKTINNIIIFKKNSRLKIKNCPKLECIESYNHFSKICIDSKRTKYTSSDKP